MNRRSASKTRHLNPDDASPMNPFLKTIRKDKNHNFFHQRTNSPLIKSRSNSPSPSNYYRNTQSRLLFCNIKLLYPILLIACILVVFYFVVLKEKDPLLFCSDDIDSVICIECPNNGICKGGKLTCNYGYVNINDFCIPDNDRIQYDVIKLYSEMKYFIASNINSACNSSNIITFGNLENQFKHKKNYHEAIEFLIKNGITSEYQIQYLPPDSFFAHKPILNTRCKIHFFYEENIITLFLFVVAIFLSVILFFVSVYNQKTNNRINACSRDVIRNIRKSQRGEFKYASEYTLSISNPMSKFWDRIADEVERNPSVTVLKSNNGKLWGYV